MVRRVLVTDADDFLGPACVARFEAAGDEVVAHTGLIASRADAEALVVDHGPFDVVVANLDAAITVATVVEHTEEQWADVFDRLVHPLHRLLAAVLPPMVEQRSGAVVIPSSATVLKTPPNPIAAYEAARAAQYAMIRSVGHEVASSGVRVNGVAPNFIENPSYFPPETVADPDFQASVRRVVPAGRLGTGDEAAAVVEWLASPEASYLVGVVVPVDGGWRIG